MPAARFISLSARDRLRRPPPAERFAQVVALNLEGPILRYSQRQRLLNLASLLGIGRFDANLIIAAVQHRSRPVARTASCRIPRWLAGLGTFLLVQSLIVLGFCWILQI